jgi:hypothetical protein
MQGFNLFVLPFLDRVRNKAGLFMGIRLMVMLLLEHLEGIVDGFSLGVGVGMWHDDDPSCFSKKKALGLQGLFYQEPQTDSGS